MGADMMQWLENLAGPQYVPAILWTLGALAALLVVLIVIRVARGMSAGTFVAGGRNRKTRLAVMDATAVDSHRRLVLVRRDDVEHLLLIGGSNDIVIEQNIRLSAPVRRPAPPEALPAQPAQQPRPRPPEPIAAPPAPRPVIPSAPAERPQPLPVSRTASPPPPVQQRPSEPVTAARPQPKPLAPPTQLVVPAPASRVAAPANPSDDTLDAGLLQELELTLENERAKTPPQRPDTNRPEPTLEDEMAKLLGELSSPKK
jgi:hypothetical protein